MKVLAIKSSLVCSLVLVGGHYAAHFWVSAERFVDRKVGGVVQEAVAAMAPSYGYEPAKAELSCLELAEREGYRRKINPALMRSLFHTESHGKEWAVSEKGALGCAQVMPFNWKRCAAECGVTGPNDLLDKEKNACCGGLIFAEDLKAEKDDISRAVQRYNGGPKCIGVCAESIKHSRKVQAKLARELR